jgi:filamentous hemagglutinin
VVLGITFVTAVLLRAQDQEKMVSLEKPPPEETPLQTKAAPQKRPSWQTSEKDVGSDLGPNVRSQVSYLNHKEVPYGTPGSVRPDFVANNSMASYEVKNYNITSNSEGLIKTVSQQAIQRQANLPVGMQQNIVIDIRGQSVTDLQKTSIIKGIVQGSNGAIDPTAIDFKE